MGYSRIKIDHIADSSLKLQIKTGVHLINVELLQLLTLVVRKHHFFGSIKISLVLKVAFIQKVLVHLFYPQTDKPNYFPELEFWNCVNLNSNHVSEGPEAALKAQIRLHFASFSLLHCCTLWQKFIGFFTMHVKLFEIQNS